MTLSELVDSGKFDTTMLLVIDLMYVGVMYKIARDEKKVEKINKVAYEHCNRLNKESDDYLCEIFEQYISLDQGYTFQNVVDLNTKLMDAKLQLLKIIQHNIKEGKPFVCA